ncbi:LOW QUALITY PROTEIN: hypothetical protein CVT26_006044 [Gymnopilus dilepis]|uniref:non-reducing end alpha-L-arabinofuranosidase n=1 Tax=Gymnopilus dilepis TaxID=231916 RepID=A0A409VQD5_9AGAR|nr:LOW QUALITY PROTEIN: hypothetical protein CVT26_006044 [Gymnopilus dilepis]
MWGFKLVSLVLFLMASKVAAVTVTVSATASHPVPTTLAEMGDFMQNLVAPGTPAALAGWQAVNGANISVIAESDPVSVALPNALHVTVPSGTSGPVGFANTGFSGIKVNARDTYKASFYYRFPTRSRSNVRAVLSLQSTSGQIFGSASVQLSGSQTTWKQVTATITPKTSSGDISNLFSITFDGASTSGQAINFAMFSLFPPTFKNRENGMRVDIAEALAEAGPSFFRLPGGNNLEGQTPQTRWQWNATNEHRLIDFIQVGPLVDRPGYISILLPFGSCLLWQNQGREGDWGYINTDGLGLLEYLHWCEDVGMQPIMAIWAGYSLGGQSIAEGDLQPYIQQAADQINFVVGDPKKSAAAALRASLGHPEPFELNYVEVGNEDFFSTTYPYRWHDFVSALQPQFPKIHFIATTNPFSPIISPNPADYDIHVYQTPDWFAQNSFFYDTFEGEYAAISTNPDNIFGAPGTGRLTFPTMQSSAGEAAFMTGLERNSDIVFAASYAPLLGTPNLLAFDAGAVYRSTSYYVQKLFSLNRGDEYLPSTLPSTNGTLFWSVVRKTKTNQIIIKISNVAAAEAPVTFALPFKHVASTGTVQVLTGPATDSNTPESPNLIVPVNSTVHTGKTFTYTAPPVSVNVLTFTAS